MDYKKFCDGCGKALEWRKDGGYDPYSGKPNMILVCPDYLKTLFGDNGHYCAARPWTIEIDE